MENNNAKIVVENVTKTFGARVAVNSINFSINKGEVVGFLGPNGAGKSTTMRLLTSYYTQNSGEIFIDSINTKDWSSATSIFWISFTPLKLSDGHLNLSILTSKV